MKKFFTLLLTVVPFLNAIAQEHEVTTSQAKNLYKTITKKRVSVHDPSVVWDATSKRYYIFGSHRGIAYTSNLQNWTGTNFKWQTATSTDATNKAAFVTPQVKTVKKGGVDVDLPVFNAMEWSARTDDSYNIDGNMWAPDVVWNPTMQKWCMYLSINGDAWHSSIILLTADKITGPYRYQAPVVICGFDGSSHSYKDTDLELVIGTQNSLPARYNVGSKWGNRWPHTIDPAAFYDEEGKLWLVYGSWSGGIWMLELNEENGLRDYDVTYPITGSGDGVTSDPYYGKKVGGGFYVSGEGPYIEHIGNYYYLFVSYGFFSPDGGYEMRVFRSNKPDGPYKDASGRLAVFDKYIMNYGTGSETRGEKLMGAYNKWGFMTVGECAQGHNSIIAAEDGKTYLVYHTKFNNGTAGHQVRVHQVWQNKQGWLVASPFEYNGENLTDSVVATSEIVEAAEIPGVYNLLIHKYKMDYKNMEEVTPVKVTLTADGKVTGAYSGTWSREEGTSYLTIKLGSVTYNGVLVEQTMDDLSIKTISFTAMANSGVNVWGYKYRGDYTIAWQLNNQPSSITNNMAVKQNLNLTSYELGTENLQMVWSSSAPDIISDYGKYYPIGLSTDSVVTFTGHYTSGNYFWQQAFRLRAYSEANAQATSSTWANDMVAHYTFDDTELTNSLNPAEKAQLLRNSTTALPTVDDQEPLRNGNTVHLNFGTNGKESYASMPNPLKGKALSNGATIAFFVKRTDNNLWDALLGLTNGDARLFLTGNLYMGYNSGTGNYLDINHPETVQTDKLGVGQWCFVVITFSRTATSTSGGVTIYVNGTKTTDKYASSLNGTEAKTRHAFDYNLIVDHLAASDALCLGKGSFWGSPDARFDDVIIYDRQLSQLEITSLQQMTNRSDVKGITEGIQTSQLSPLPSKFIYDLQGRRVVNGRAKGLYIRNGKKYLIQ